MSNNEKPFFEKKNIVVIFLILFTVVLNVLIFSNQLNYGFRDVDWMMLYIFKNYGISLHGLGEEFKILGVYIPESYYVGLLENFIGLNFMQLHLATHVFKIIAGISIYFLVLKVFKRKLLAFITSLFYTISYSHAGVLFQLSSGGYFLTTIAMVLFLISYHNSFFEKRFLRWSIFTGILLIIELFLKAERTYPLIALVFLIDFSFLVFGRFKKYLWIISMKRVLLIFLPLIIFSLFYQIALTISAPQGFAPGQFSINTNIRIDSITKGNWQLLLYPLSSLGSLFLYEDYWKLLGGLNFQNIGPYITSLVTGPVLRLGIITYIIFYLLSKNPFKWTLVSTVCMSIFGLIVYTLNINWQNIDPVTRIHFDPNQQSMPAIFGFYVFVLWSLLLVKWIKSKDQVLLPSIIGFIFSFIFIFLTWLPSDLQLSFMGPQRYLSMPSIGTSLFFAGLLMVIFDRLRVIKFTKNFAWMIFLIFIPLITINFQIANNFFNYELTYAGLQKDEQIRMKGKFRQITAEISQKDRSLFYFDESADKENGYFDEGTTIAGFEFWTRVNTDGSLNHIPEPGQMRTNIQCPEHTHKNCVDILKSGLSIENGKQGIWYQDTLREKTKHFYPLNAFYAVRFINKDIVDIKKEVLKEIGVVNLPE